MREELVTNSNRFLKKKLIEENIHLKIIPIIRNDGLKFFNLGPYFYKLIHEIVV